MRTQTHRESFVQTKDNQNFFHVCSRLLASADSVSVLKKRKKTRLREFASLNMKSILKKVHINLMSTDSSASTIPLEKQRIYHTVCVGVGRCVGFINYTVYIYIYLLILMHSTNKTFSVIFATCILPLSR